MSQPNPEQSFTIEAKKLASVAAPGQFFVHDKYKTHFVKRGKGERVILALHKVTSGGEAWASVLDSLESEFTIVSPDLLGHGYSARSVKGYFLETYCRQIINLLEYLDYSHVILLGHSLGARVALAMAYYAPDVIESIVCIEPPLCGPGKPEYPYDLTSVVTWRERVVQQGVDFCLKSQAGYTYEQAEIRARYGVLCDEHVLPDTWQGFKHQSMDDYLRSVKCPAALIYGDNGVIQDSQIKEATNLCKDLKAYCIEDCGHNPPWENNKDFINSLRTFLQSESCSLVKD